MKIKKENLPAVLVILLISIQSFFREDEYIFRWILLTIMILYVLSLILFRKFRKENRKEDVIGILGMSFGVIILTLSSYYFKVIGVIVVVSFIAYYLLEPKKDRVEDD